MQWILNNKEWVFSGVGVFILTIVGSIIFKTKSCKKNTQNIGDNSFGIQAGRDVKIGRK